MDAMRAKVATAGVGLTLVGNLLFGVMRRVEAIEGERYAFQVTVEHRLTAIETKRDALLAQGGAGTRAAGGREALGASATKAKAAERL